ncbi:lanthionine synthetase C family protein [Archangium gephyra]|nr:lanthionine synthetase C family protein [Archangium gephyra]
MPQPMRWSPLLEGAERETALRLAAGIAEELSRPERLAAPNPTLSSGQAGMALLFSYLARESAQARHLECVEQLLDSASEAVATQPLPPDLYQGFSGIAWAVEHLRGTAVAEEDPLTEIDEALAGLLRTQPWEYHYDLVSGLVGLGVYALERIPRPGARDCLEQIVARLAELAQPSEGGLRWWTPPPLLPASMRGQFPEGACNLGVAHGVPGVLWVLAGAAATGTAASQALEMLRGGWSGLMAQRQPAASASRFPSWLGANHQTWPNRPAWCYGDPGMALTLLQVARAVKEPGWEQEALSLCREVAERSTDGAQVQDAGLCHGAAGLAHLHHRLFRATGEERFARAARAWFRNTLSFHRPGEGLGGFLSHEVLPDLSREWLASPALLTGATGVALALLAAASPVEPAWDRMFLMSLPPSSSSTP